MVSLHHRSGRNASAGRKQRQTKTKESKMNLNEYEKVMSEIETSALSSKGKAAAFDKIASEIGGIAWQPHAKGRARDVAASARAASDKFGGPTLEGLDELAKNGLLQRK
jgi:hypothetical protein